MFKEEIMGDVRKKSGIRPVVIGGIIVAAILIIGTILTGYFMTASLLRTGFPGKKGPFSRIAWRVYHADVSKLYQKYEQIVNLQQLSAILRHARPFHRRVLFLP